MKIENGKYYRTADGRKVGPMLGGPAVYWILYTGRWCSEGTSLHDCDPDLVAEWHDEPTVWGDMTPEQKGALLLAHHEGRGVQTLFRDGWGDCPRPLWGSLAFYRIKPDPVVETRDVYADGNPAIKIGTINLIDGNPDPATLNLETSND